MKERKRRSKETVAFHELRRTLEATDPKALLVLLLVKKRYLDMVVNSMFLFVVGVWRKWISLKERLISFRNSPEVRNL